MQETISPEERALQARVFSGPQPKPAPVTHKNPDILFAATHPERPRKRRGTRYEFGRGHRKPIDHDIVPVNEIAPEPEPPIKEEWKPDLNGVLHATPQDANQWNALVEHLEASKAMCKRFAELADEMIALIGRRTA